MSRASSASSVPCDACQWCLAHPFTCRPSEFLLRKWGFHRVNSNGQYRNLRVIDSLCRPMSAAVSGSQCNRFRPMALPFTRQFDYVVVQIDLPLLMRSRLPNSHNSGARVPAGSACVSQYLVCVHHLTTQYVEFTLFSAAEDGPTCDSCHRFRPPAA